jgi:hypothetical protein
VNGRVPPFSFVIVPSTPPWLACFAFGDATFAVVPATPPVLVVAVELEETLVVLDELTFELVFVFAFVFGEELTCTDADVPAVAAVVHACVPFLTAWTSGACVEPGHATLCGWLLPGP